MTRRTDRIGELIRSTLAEIILREIRDPRARLVSVTQVDVAPDLQRATVLVSVLNDEENERIAVIEVLQRAQGFLRSRLAKRLKDLRRLPELNFVLDRGAEFSQRINDILEDLDHDNDPHA